jgi:hypothetical protein
VVKTGEAIAKANESWPRQRSDGIHLRRNMMSDQTKESLPMFAARFAAVLAVLLMGAVDPAMAQRRGGGCGGSGLSCDQLKYYCSMGSQTPISARPYCGAVGGQRGGGDGRRGGYGGGHGRGGGCGGSGLSCDQLRYYCSMGSQTPISARPYCGAVGIGGGHRGGGYGGRYQGHYNESRPLSRRELEYYCSMGSQTPISARADCVRYGYW